MSKGGTLRISYRGRKTVFLYKLGDKSQVEEMLAGHVRHWSYESVPSKDDPSVTVVSDIDQTAMVLEWVTDIGTPAEKSVPIPNPYT